MSLVKETWVDFQQMLLLLYILYKQEIGYLDLVLIC